MKHILCQETGEIYEYENEEWESLKNTALQEWYAADQEIKKLDAVRKAAMAKYVELVAHPDKVSGTQYDELEKGWKCKITKTPNFGFKKDENNKVDNNAISDMLGQIADKIENGALLAGKLVTWRPEVSIGTYKALPDEAKRIADEIIVQNKSYVKLELVAPKEIK